MTIREIGPLALTLGPGSHGGRDGPGHGADRGREQQRTVPPSGCARLDLRLVPAVLAVWCAAGVVPTASDTAVCIAALLMGAIGVLLLVRRRTVIGTVAAGALLCGAASSLVTLLHWNALRDGPVRALAEDRRMANLELVVSGDPRRHDPRTRGAGPAAPLIVIPARVAAVESGGVHERIAPVPVIVFATDVHWIPLIPGTHVQAVGRLALPDPREPIAATFSARGSPRVLAGPPWVQRAAAHLRAGLRAAVTGLDPPERGLVPAMVVGDISGMEVELRDDFRATGMAHLTAVSGDTARSRVFLVEMGKCRVNKTAGQQGETP